MNSSKLITISCISQLLWICTVKVSGFATPQILNSQYSSSRQSSSYQSTQSVSPSTTALSVWWFGGTDSRQNVDSHGDSCELVPIRIEKPSANSRRIAGEIIVEAPMNDVWAILTDYDRLAVHVPNLVESRIVRKTTRENEQGDGSFKCRLYQKGAQNIVGFDFSASVTMDMAEKIMSSSSSEMTSPKIEGEGDNGRALSNDRSIGFKCHDSFFFNAFDGEWKVYEQLDENGEVETKLIYDVLVKPKGPVPVAALEWQIREEVPTNLRAVKKAALLVGEEGVLAARARKNGVARISSARVNNAMQQVANEKRAAQISANGITVQRVAAVQMNDNRVEEREDPDPSLVPAMWEESETMGAYL